MYTYVYITHFEFRKYQFALRRKLQGCGIGVGVRRKFLIVEVGARDNQNSRRQF
jgi:hypothetical protein